MCSDKAVDNGGINFFELVEGFRNKLNCRVDLSSTSLKKHVCQLDLCIDGKVISNIFVAKSITELMLKSGLEQVGDGDFCGEGSHGCLEFVDGQSGCHVVVFTNDTKRSGRLYVNFIKYPS